MHIELILSFCLTSILIELTPGPNMAYLAIVSSRYGKRVGFLVTAGIAVGLLLIGVAAAFGLAQLIQQSTLAYQILRWSGIVYLFWLAWDAWRDAEMATGSDNPFNNTRFFLRGLLTNLLNPKAAIFYIAILPRFIHEDSNLNFQMAILVCLYVGIATIIHLFIVSMASQTQRFLQSASQRRLFSRTLAILLAAVACWFAWATSASL